MKTNHGVLNNFPVPLAENFWVLGNYYFNLYLIKGESASAIIEAGTSGVVDAVLMQLEALDIKPTYLIITHPHADHVTGLNGLLDKYPDMTIVAGQEAREFLTHPKALNVLINEDRYISNMLWKLGVKTGRPPIEKFVFPEKHIAVEGNYNVDLGGIMLKCIKVRGHSPGNIIVHIPAINALVLSDSLGFHYPGRGILPLFLTDYSEYLHTIDYMVSLNPAILGLGHQGPVTGSEVENAFKEARAAAVKMFSRIKNEKRNSREVAEEIFNECYKDEFIIYSEDNIRSVAQLLVRRAMEV